VAVSVNVSSSDDSGSGSEEDDIAGECVDDDDAAAADADTPSVMNLNQTDTDYSLDFSDLVAMRECFYCIAHSVIEDERKAQLCRVEELAKRLLGQRNLSDLRSLLLMLRRSVGSRSSCGVGVCATEGARANARRCEDAIQRLFRLQYDGAVLLVDLKDL
jgi:hypothetical protein